jgi:Ni,Fe-hydrogenase III small subunit
MLMTPAPGTAGLLGLRELQRRGGDTMNPLTRLIPVDVSVRGAALNPKNPEAHSAEPIAQKPKT